VGKSADYSQNFTVKLVVTATAEYNNNRKNYYPGAVVVKDMAKTVVIHYVILQSRSEPWLNTILCLWRNIG
jgi:hypothetical protein